MPVSKRDKKVSLTKTSKKGATMKKKIIDDIRENLEKYDNVFVFTVNNMRNGSLKEAREEWKGSGRFFLAKRKLMALSLGTTAEKELKKDLHKVAGLLLGECGLFMTSKPKDEVVQWFESFTRMDFARSGFVATETVELPSGPLPDFPAAIEPHLRSLGLPTKLEKGVVVLRENFTVCTGGTKITSPQSQILKLLKKEMAEFKITLICAWSKDGTFEKFKAAKEFKKTPQKPVKSNLTVKTPETQISKEESIDKDDLLMEIEEYEADSDEESEQETVKSQNQPPHLESNKTPIKVNITPKGTPNQTDNSAKQQQNTPKQTPKQNNKTSDQTRNQNNKTPKQDNKTPKQASNTPNSNKKSKQTPKQNKKTFIKSEMDSSQTKESEINDDTQSEVDENESFLVEPSPKLGKGNPRRSMRTPKPLKRTPEQKRLSVKKLTESAKLKGSPKAKGTPKQTTASARKLKS